MFYSSVLMCSRFTPRIQPSVRILGKISSSLLTLSMLSMPMYALDATAPVL